MENSVIKFWDDNIVSSHVNHEISVVLDYFNEKGIKEISYVDIGANVGKYYEILSNNLKINDVYMVEPEPKLYEYLTKKFEKFKIYNFAISDYVGESFFDNYAADYFFNNENLDGLNLGVSKLTNTNNGFVVKTISGYEFLKTYVYTETDKIDFIKIDTENRDYNILNSIKEIIKTLQDKPFIVLEHNYHNDMSKENAKKIYYDFIEECDYVGIDFEELTPNVYLKPKN